MAGVRVPIVTHALQAFVTEPLKPFLHVILVSATLHVYVSQTDREGGPRAARRSSRTPHTVSEIAAASVSH